MSEVSKWGVSLLGERLVSTAVTPLLCEIPLQRIPTSSKQKFRRNGTITSTCW